MTKPRAIVDFEDCPDCDGTGAIEAGFWPCPHCNGTGSAPIYADEIDDEYDYGPETD